MKILIVHDDVIEASKIKLVLAKYGNCETASGGKNAIEMFKKAHSEAAPYAFINLEMDMGDMKGNMVAAEIRKWETEHKKEPRVKILIVLSEADRQTAGPFLEKSGVQFLVKPYNRKIMETTLKEIGLEKAAPPPQKPAAPAAPQTQTDKKKEIDLILKKLTALITDPDQLQDIESRQALEELVTKGGKQAQLLMGQYITSAKLPMHTRMELIRSASYIRSPLFLVPLNRVIDTEDNIRLVERALISISKYSDQRALNILSNALKKLKNPMLLNTLRREIAKIKQDNPVLAILPRFLQSHKSLKNFRVTLDILKKIVTPNDTTLFINYLRAGNETLELGTFELLCFSGDASIKESIFGFFEDRVAKLNCLDQPECDPLYRLMLSLKQYMQQNPSLVDERIANFKELYGKARDIRARQLTVSILCQSQNPAALDFIKAIYAEAEDLQAWVVEQLSGNPAAVDFLFERYHEGGEWMETVIISLLKSEKGLHFFVDNFFTFELDRQEFIVKKLPFRDDPYLVEFIRKIYNTQLYSLKHYMLKVIRENFLFSFKDILFDPDKQREFMFMGKDYLETIIRLFPITSMWMLFKKIAYDDISTNKIKDYLDLIQRVAGIEPVIRFNDMKFIQDLFKRVYKANNIELYAKYFSVFEHMKTMDLRTYKYLLDASSSFVQSRGANITDNEKGAVNKLKQKLIDQFPDIRDIENLYKDLQVIFANKPISHESLEKLLKTNHTAVALNIDKVCVFLAGRLKRGEYISMDDRQVFFMQFPMIAGFIEYLWEQGFDKLLEWENIPPQPKLVKHFAGSLKFVINFQNKKIGSLLKDQLKEVFPEFEIILDKEKPETTDILLCDTEVLQGYIDKRSLSARRILLYLENRMDYAPFRSLNCKVFMRPISGHKIVKLLLKDLYL